MLQNPHLSVQLMPQHWCARRWHHVSHPRSGEKPCFSLIISVALLISPPAWPCMRLSALSTGDDRYGLLESAIRFLHGKKHTDNFLLGLDAVIFFWKGVESSLQ